MPREILRQDWEDAPIACIQESISKWEEKRQGPVVSDEENYADVADLIDRIRRIASNAEDAKDTAREQVRQIVEMVNSHINNHDRPVSITRSLLEMLQEWGLIEL